LGAYLFVRSWKLWIIAVVLIDLVWIVSERAAVFSIADHNAGYYPGMAGAGLLGGLGVGASTGLGCCALLSLRSLAAASGAGGLSALPFRWWVQTNLDEPRSGFAGVACFAIWQPVVGTTLWARSSTICDLLDTAPGR
jgi:hypothetical protein